MEGEITLPYIQSFVVLKAMMLLILEVYTCAYITQNIEEVVMRREAI